MSCCNGIATREAAKQFFRKISPPEFEATDAKIQSPQTSTTLPSAFEWNTSIKTTSTPGKTLSPTTAPTFEEICLSQTCCVN